MSELYDERLPQRFWEKVEVGESGCWLWQGYLKENGYGQFSPASYRQAYAHRVAYENLVGPIPAKFVIDHLCRVPSCVNPEHLEAVSNRENTIRGKAVENGKHNSNKTRCPAGHSYAGENLYVTPRGYRVCRACVSYHGKKYRKRKKQHGTT